MKKNNIWLMLGMICGVLAVVFGIIVLSQDGARAVDTSLKFGGDFYTHSYKATAVAAYNVQKLYELISLGIGFLLITFGLTNVCTFGLKLSKQKSIADVESDTKSE